MTGAQIIFSLLPLSPNEQGRLKALQSVIKQISCSKRICESKFPYFKYIQTKSFNDFSNFSAHTKLEIFKFPSKFDLMITSSGR